MFLKKTFQIFKKSYFHFQFTYRNGSDNLFIWKCTYWNSLHICKTKLKHNLNVWATCILILLTRSSDVLQKIFKYVFFSLLSLSLFLFVNHSLSFCLCICLSLFSHLSVSLHVFLSFKYFCFVVRRLKKKYDRSICVRSMQDPSVKNCFWTFFFVVVCYKLF